MIRIYMLGEFRISVTNAEVFPPFPTQKATSLTAYLIKNPQQWHSREFLADMLWPDHPAQNARRSLLTALWQIRTTLKKGGMDPEQFLKTTITHITWNETENIWLDIREFDRAVKANSIEELKKALALYKGHFLPHLYDDWCLTERYRLEAVYQATLLKLIALQIRAKHIEDAIVNARKMLQIDALNEEAHRALIYCYYQQGGRPAAIEQYRECTRRLKEELDIQPSEETQKLYQNILEEKIPRIHQKETYQANLKEKTVSVRHTPSKSLPPATDIFIGRETELQILSDWWENQEEICAYIKGAYGIGKTRLVVEFCRVLEAQGGVLVGWGRGLPTGTNVPYYALFSVIRILLQQIQETEHNKMPAWLIKELAHFFPEVGEDQNIVEISSETKFDLSPLLSTICNLLAFIAKTQSLLIVFDDLHWASESVVQLLEYVVRFLETEQHRMKHAVKILFTGPSEVMMPGYVAKMLFRLNYDHLVLDLPLQNLNRDAVLQWLELWSGEQSSVLNFSDLLYQQLNGNPFLITEMVRALFMAGSLSKGESGWEGEILTRKDAHLPVPAFIIRQIQNQIRDFSPNAVELLNAAAVAGQVFNIQVLQRVLNLDEPSFFKAVDELLQAHLIGETETGLPYDFEFHHHLFQEAIYNQISFIRRMSLHRRIAQGIEDEYGESAAGIIFHHYQMASDPSYAATWALKAGQQAMDQSAFQKAAELLDKAEKYSVEPKVPDEVKGQIWTGLYRLYLKSGNKDKMYFYSERLRILAQKTEEQNRLKKNPIQKIDDEKAL